jgi:hypothetical protein
MGKGKGKRLYVAITTGFVEVDGQDHMFRKGEIVRGDHALLKAAPANFEPAENFSRDDIGDGTLAPGTKRRAPVEA